MVAAFILQNASVINYGCSSNTRYFSTNSRLIYVNSACCPAVVKEVYSGFDCRCPREDWADLSLVVAISDSVECYLQAGLFLLGERD